MTNLLKVLVVALITFTTTAQTKGEAMALNSSSTAGIFEFETELIDYGTIKQNSEGKRTFSFKNTGKSPIIISKVKASCGCTVPTKPNQPIMPGETAEIDVQYATKRIGSFSKTITITSNASESTKVVRIKGNILKDGTVGLNKKKSIVSVN